MGKTSGHLKRIFYADDDTASVEKLAFLRIPPLMIGLFLGLILSFITSRFEEVLTQNVHVVFFLPLIVYMAAAVGNQTQSIYTRDLRTGKARFHTYLIKETILGILLGVIASVVAAIIVMLWLHSRELALAVGLAMFGAIATAPLVALLVTELLQLEHADPAVGAGPIATVIQDAISVLIYGIIASSIIL